MTGFSYSLQRVFTELRRSICLALPLAGLQLIYALNGMVIMLMIARLGRDELATNALVLGIYITLFWFFAGILHAMSALIAQRYGSGDKTGMQIFVTQGIILASIVTAAMMLIMWFSPKILYWTGQNPVNIQLAIPYCHALTSAMLPLILYLVIEQFLIGVAAARLMFFLGIIKAFLEILFVYIFLFGKWGIPKLGLAGAGYGKALSFSIIVLVVLSYICFAKRFRDYRLFANFYKINTAYLRNLIRVGLPIGSMYCAKGALFAVAAFMMGRLGNNVLAAHQIAYQCFFFIMVLLFGVSQATTARIGYELGRNNKTALQLIAHVHVGLVFCFVLMVAVLYIWFPKNIIWLSAGMNALQNQILFKHAVTFLLLASMFQLTESLRLVSIGALRGLSDTKIPMYINIIAFWLTAFPIACFLAFGLNLGGVGIWLGLITGSFVGAIISLIRFKYLVTNLSDGFLKPATEVVF